MKRFIAHSLLFITAGIAVLGVFIIHSETNIDGWHENCGAAIVNGARCPGDPLAAVIFHVTAARFFGTAIVGALLALGLALAIGAKRRSGPAVLSVQRNSGLSFIVPSFVRCRDWLAFHENSPPSCQDGLY